MASFAWHVLTQTAYNTNKFDFIRYVEETGVRRQGILDTERKNIRCASGSLV